MNCILHIGAEKSGSTSLQHWFYANRACLAESGICLSDALGSPTNRKLSLYFQRRVDGWTKTNDLEDRDKRRAFLKPALDRLRQEVKQAENDAHTFLITSEHLHSRLDRQDLLDELGEFMFSLFESIEVVGYVRNQAELAVSAYSTALRVNETRSLADYIKNIGPETYTFNHHASASLWSNTFGNSSVRFRVFDNCLKMANGVVTDFAENVLELSELPAITSSTNQLNSRLTPLQAAAFRKINALYPRWPNDSVQALLNRKMKKKILKEPSDAGRKLQLSNPTDFLDKFKHVNELFFERFGDGDNCFSSERYQPSDRNGNVDISNLEPDLDAFLKPLLAKYAHRDTRLYGQLWPRLKFWQKL
ncbi:MAG: hypothetical protein NXI27_00965 [Alphaproteobacteria bacterium]|nr:hypothetical protein [Alphaproteobacteria bacterium]